MNEDLIDKVIKSLKDKSMAVRYPDVDAHWRDMAIGAIETMEKYKNGDE